MTHFTQRSIFLSMSNFFFSISQNKISLKHLQASILKFSINSRYFAIHIVIKFFSRRFFTSTFALSIVILRKLTFFESFAFVFKSSTFKFIFVFCTINSRNVNARLLWISSKLNVDFYKFLKFVETLCFKTLLRQTLMCTRTWECRKEEL